MTAAIIELLSAGLSLWQSKESRKYMDRLIGLKKAYHEEWIKDVSVRDDSVLDSIEFDIKLLCDSFVSSVGREQNPKN